MAFGRRWARLFPSDGATISLDSSCPIDERRPPTRCEVAPAGEIAAAYQAYLLDHGEYPTEVQFHMPQPEVGVAPIEDATLHALWARFFSRQDKPLRSPDAEPSAPASSTASLTTATGTNRQLARMVQQATSPPKITG